MCSDIATCLAFNLARSPSLKTQAGLPSLRRFAEGSSPPDAPPLLCAQARANPLVVCFPWSSDTLCGLLLRCNHWLNRASKVLINAVDSTTLLREWSRKRCHSGVNKASFDPAWRRTFKLQPGPNVSKGAEKSCSATASFCTSGTSGSQMATRRQGH
jgi:hypothetical protein